MKDIIIFIISNFLIICIVFIGFPYIWKISGGSFVWGNVVIYKGKELFIKNPTCGVLYNSDFSEVKQICNGKTMVWINGIEQTKQNKDKK